MSCNYCPCCCSSHCFCSYISSNIILRFLVIFFYRSSVQSNLLLLLPFVVVVFPLEHHLSSSSPVSFLPSFPSRVHPHRTNGSSLPSASPSHHHHPSNPPCAQSSLQSPVAVSPVLGSSCFDIYGQVAVAEARHGQTVHQYKCRPMNMESTRKTTMASKAAVAKMTTWLMK